MAPSFFLSLLGAGGGGGAGVTDLADLLPASPPPTFHPLHIGPLLAFDLLSWLGIEGAAVVALVLGSRGARPRRRDVGVTADASPMDLWRR